MANELSGATAALDGRYAPAEADPGRTSAQARERWIENHHRFIVCLRREIENTQGAVGRLELLLHERSARIDELNGKLERRDTAQVDAEELC